MAGAGGLMGLRLVDRFIAPQPLDIVTMLGFIILVGTVVNNAIFIVHQALNNVRYLGAGSGRSAGIGENPHPAHLHEHHHQPVRHAASGALHRGRQRTLPGPGSVILGGLAVSTVFTLFIIPSLLAFFIPFEKSRQEK
jgi:HAE1 family hydrophobic/amphiphilic exporter-1